MATPHNSDILTRNFTYEGSAPDAFLIAGVKTPKPNDYPDVIFPFPFKVGILILLLLRYDFETGCYRASI